MEKLISDVINSNSQYWVQKRNTHVINVYDDFKVRDALKVLASNKILSVPVIERATGDYLGFIDMNDILHSIIDSFLANNSQQDGHDWVRLCHDVSVSEKFANQPVSVLINQSKKDFFIPVDESGSIHQLIDEIFSKGIHRVIVVGEDAKTKGIISQTDILEFILENRDEIKGADFEKPIGQLKDLVEKDVITINAEVMTIQCYYVMMKHSKQSIALTGKHGEIIGNLSITDLRGLDPENFELLLSPAIDFWNKTNSKSKICVVPSSTTFKEIINILYKNRLHRLWLSSEEEGGCYGTVTIGNIMKYFSRDQHEVIRRNSLSSSSGSLNLNSSSNSISKKPLTPVKICPIVEEK
ncbi:hypothetical protein ACTFIW_005241 [Dictyostelium discoideum]